MNRRRVILIIVALTALVLLALAPAALAAAGGGSAGFSGGGDGGGGGGGGSHLFEIYILIRIAEMGHGLGLLFLIAVGLIYWFYRNGGPKVQAWFAAQRQRGTARKRDTRKRERKVELAAAEAADTDPVFDPEHVRTAAASLFTAIQFAWDKDDRIALRGLVAPELLAEWERRLDDFERKGWRNRIELKGDPVVEYVGLARGRRDDAQDRVVVKIEARLRDYVVDGSGRHLKRSGEFTESVRLREYWTLGRRGDHWILASVEQGAEGSHALEDAVVPTAWSDRQALQDEAMIEGAVADAVPEGVRIADVADLDYSGDGRAAANDLSLADGRFAPAVLEIAARHAVDAWAQAVDGSDAQLRTLADAPVVRELLHPGDPSEQTRVVVRGPVVKRITIVALDAAADPATMTIDVALRGRRYIEERGTTRVLLGNPARATDFTERWTFAVTGDATTPWRIVAVQSPAVTA